MKPWNEALVEFVEKSALLRESIRRRGDEEHYAARVDRMSVKLDALAESLEQSEPEVAKAVRAAWGRPVRSLAFRNAAHQKERDGEGDA
ncbi:MAG: hypothetical protein U0P82_04465 [Vicinamibacterales bacterium]